MRARVLGIVLGGLLVTVVTVGGQGAGPRPARVRRDRRRPAKEPSKAIRR